MTKQRPLLVSFDCLLQGKKNGAGIEIQPRF